MKAVIMAGGFGTRLRPLTSKLPKPMVPVLGFPMLDHITKLLKRHGFDDIVILLYFQAEKITEYLGDGSKYGLKFTYLKPDKDLGTAGAVKFAEKYLNEKFLVISGDLFTDFNLTKCVEFHNKKKADATMVLTRVENPLSFGIVLTDKEGKIKKFLEKPIWGEVFSDGINTGIYILEPKILKEMPEDIKYDFSKELFPKLLKKNASLWGYICKGYWKDVGNLSEYLNVHSDFFNGMIDAHLSYEKYENDVYLGEDVKIDKDSKVENAIIGSNTEFKGDIRIIRSVIGRNCKIGYGVELVDSVIWDNVVIKDNAKITNSSITNANNIGSGSRIGDYVHIGENCNIGEKSVIKSGVKIWPDKMVEDGAVLSHSLVWTERWHRNLFTNSRITGISNYEISPEFCAKLGSAYGAFIGEGKSIATSRDFSLQARMAKRSIICGLSSSGVTSVDYRVTAIPVLRSDMRNEDIAGGIHVRKSPRDKRLIDIIFFDRGGKDLPTGKVKSIERLFFGEDYRLSHPDKIGKIDYPVRITERYISSILNAIDEDVFRNRKLKIVIDYSFGISSTILPQLLGEMNMDVVSLNAFMDPDKFPVTKEEFNYQVEQLSTIVKSLKADIGFIINPNMEQIYVVDENGEFLNNTELSVVLVKMLLETGYKDKIAAPVNASFILDEICNQKNIDLIRIKSTHRDMISAGDIEGVKVIVGTRGGYIFTDANFACDSVVACVKFLELMLKNNSLLGELKGGFKFTSFSEAKLFTPWKNKGKIMRYLLDETENHKRDLIDGIRIFEDDVVVNLMPSSISPQFEILAESYNKEKAEKAVQKWKDKISEANEMD